jgi:hypothetical protein
MRESIPDARSLCLIQKSGELRWNGELTLEASGKLEAGRRTEGERWKDRKTETRRTRRKTRRAAKRVKTFFMALHFIRSLRVLRVSIFDLLIFRIFRFSASSHPRRS